MAAKKKTKKKPNKTAAKNWRLVKKTAGKKLAKKKPSRKKKLAKKLLKRAAAKTKKLGRKRAATKSARALRELVPGISHSLDTEAFAPQALRSRSAGQSGDLQGLSNVEAADSESVDELLEEGNAFEAEVVAGVESAGDDEKEIRTHEVPEDDVPDEYLDKE